MATDQEFRDLEAVVATLRRDLRESQDTINLWRQNGLGHLDSGSGKWRFGGNRMQLDNNGMQVRTGGSDTVAIYFLEALRSNPTLATTFAKLLANVSESGDSASLQVHARSLGGFDAKALASAGASDSTAKIESTEVADGRSAAVFTYIDNTQATAFINASLGLGTAYGNNPSILSPSQITSDQNNYSPTNWSDAGLVLRLSTDASRDITGLASGREGRTALLVNVGSFDIVLKDENAGSTSVYRFALDGDITLAPDTGAVLWYDTITERWRCAGRYSAGGGAGDVATDTLWDALGDLAVGTGANTANNLPVGTDGYVLTADSTDLSFGIKWAPAAGGPGGSTSIARTLMLMGA